MQQFTSNPAIFIAFIISIIAILLSVYSFFLTRQLNKLKAVFFSGTQAADLESVIQNLHLNHQSLADEQANTALQLSKLSQKSQFSIQKVGLVRFNPFDDGGGNFSFSLALMDHHNSGVIITSMYGRQQNRIYTKKLNQGVSETPLTKEEQEAITQANF